MKILVFGGGLGNQLFGYAFAEYLRNRFPMHKIFGVYNKMMLNEHNGLELERWFDVNMPPSKWWVSFITYFLYVIKKLTGWKRMLDLDQNVIQNENALVFFAQHTDKRYIPVGDWIKFKINEDDLKIENKRIMEAIRFSNSVFIHVRRGDYLSPKYKDRFDGCCTIEYYNEAIKYIMLNVNNPKFFVFSNDLNWVKENLNINSATFVDWNSGADSSLDMYLMSQCKHAIIANSTFSWWGAILGNKKEYVTYPKRWVNYPFKIGDIFPDDWHSI